MQKGSLEVLFELLKSGLWGLDIRLLPYGKIEYGAIYQLAEDQSVVGLVAAGLEHIEDVKVLKVDALPFLKKVVSLEQRNHAMNEFIRRIVNKMRDVGIYAILVKGQGVAQCYERPQWRSSGDIDFFFSDENYDKAKSLLVPMASKVEDEFMREKHLGMTIDSWVVELHGTLYGGPSSRVEKELDDIKRDTFIGGNVRAWQNEDVSVFLLSVENDVFYIFTHILQHFYKGGIGLRQICDWCRLLWTYRFTLDLKSLEERVKRAGLVSEWKAFGAFAIYYLGLPLEAVPLVDSQMLLSPRLKRQVERIKDFILMSGNFGQNRDMSYYSKFPYIIRKAISLCRRIGDLCRHALIFPLDSLRFFPSILFNGVRSAMRGE
ncbi:MAG: nucleotidyltransferase family protein [Prevotella sp.]|nr:nucleotidyltransferase family protein [Prevotella sp.]